MELVRVGSPQRPEMAAWRYGDQFGRRRRRALVQAGVGLSAAGALVAGGAWVGVGIPGFTWMFGRVIDRIVKGNPDKVVATVPGEGGKPMEVRRAEAFKTRLIATGDRMDWRLEVHLWKCEMVYKGDAAVRAAAQLLPSLNRYGGSRRHVAGAVDFLEQAGSVETTFRNATVLTEGNMKATIEKLPYPVRLALEMAAHEEAERRALEGELAELERAWREPEEIAEISDNLLMPASVNDWIRRIRGGWGGSTTP